MHIYDYPQKKKKKRHQPGFKTWYAFGIPRNESEVHKLFDQLDAFFRVRPGFAFPHTWASWLTWANYELVARPLEKASGLQ